MQRQSGGAGDSGTVGLWVHGATPIDGLGPSAPSESLRHSPRRNVLGNVIWTLMVLHGVAPNITHRGMLCEYPQPGGGGGGDVLEGGRGLKEGGGVGWDPPPPMVPLWSQPKAAHQKKLKKKLKSSWHQRRRSKILAVSLKHWKGRRGGGSRGWYPLLLLRWTVLIHHWGGGVLRGSHACA